MILFTFIFSDMVVLLARWEKHIKFKKKKLVTNNTYYMD